MAETKVIMPQMGESIFEGTVTKWLKKEGDKVERDEPLFEISTDKVDSEIPAPASGTLTAIMVNEGQTVQINTVVALIGTGVAEGASAAPAQLPETRAEAASLPKAAIEAAAPSKPLAVTAAERVRSSPLVRRIAKDHGIELGALSGKGTGAGGRITKRDILSHLEQPDAARPAPSSPAPAVSFSGPVERVAMTAMRKSIAEHMVMSKRVSPHVATVFEVDCAAIMKAKDRLKPEYEQSGIRLTVTAFFAQAAIQALKAHPILNSSVDGDHIVYKRAINLGIAVALDWGLIVPVIRNADEKNLQGLARAINDAGERARAKKLTPDDVRDGTFTITNPGVFGGLFGIPVINQPQVAILGMGGVKKRAVVIDDAIAIRPMAFMSLSFDHRIIDGAVADQFMAEIRNRIENWNLQ